MPLQLHAAFPLHALVGSGEQPCQLQLCSSSWPVAAVRDGQLQLPTPCSRRVCCPLPARPPVHPLQVGGGDQLYSDGVWQCPALKAWGASTDQ